LVDGFRDNVVGVIMVLQELTKITVETGVPIEIVMRSVKYGVQSINTFATLQPALTSEPVESPLIYTAL